MCVPFLWCIPIIPSVIISYIIYYKYIVSIGLYRGVGDGAPDGGFPWRGECLPPTDRPLKEENTNGSKEDGVINGGREGLRSSSSSGRPNTRGKGNSLASGGTLRLTRKWSLASWSEYLQNAPILK